MHRIFLIFIFLLLLLISPKSVVFAGTCNFTYNPTPVTQDTGNVSVSFSTPDVPDGSYRAHYRGPGGAPTYVSPDTALITISGGNGSFSIPKLGSSWKAGRHEIYLIPQGKSVNDYAKESSCKGSFSVAETAITSSTSSCNTSIENTSIDPSSDVALVIHGAIPQGGYDIKVDGSSKRAYQTSEGPKVSLGTFPTGDHKVEIRERCGFAGISCLGSSPRLICSATAFRVVNRGSPGGGEIKLSDAQVFSTDICKKNPGSDLCSKAGGVKCPQGEGVFTGIGCIPTKPQALVEGILKYGTFAAGGIAFLIMILAAIQMITAEGNPESIKHAQERFYSAIIGLLLIIFSILLMQVIGVDILGLSGFNS